MKTLVLLVAIVVGICSIVLFRERASDIASLATAYLFAISNISNNSSSDTATSTVPDEHAAASNMSVPRAIRKVFLAIEQAEGAGARVRRSIGTPSMKNLSPFLMLDHFSIKPGSGFPDQYVAGSRPLSCPPPLFSSSRLTETHADSPHRGQETITYLLQGGVDHEDFAGNAGTIGPGDLQFMTAGRGIMHAEMPRHNADGSANVGLQLWVDLPEQLKMCEPRYRDLRAAEIPAADSDDGKVHVRVISGRSHGVDSVKDLAYTPVWILDVEIQPGGRLVQPLPQGWNAFAYTLEGQTVFGSPEDKDGGQTVDQFHNVVFAQDGDVVHAEVAAAAERGARFVLVAGLPLDQPVVQYGPFVLSSKEDVYQALMDYQTHSNGFERAKGWQSEIGKSMVQ